MTARGLLRSEESEQANPVLTSRGDEDQLKQSARIRMSEARSGLLEDLVRCRSWGKKKASKDDTVVVSKGKQSHPIVKNDEIEVEVCVGR